MSRAAQPSATPFFWRDPVLPFVEARQIDDGRRVSYGRHWHDTVSVGAILGGRSTYLNGSRNQEIQQGTLVMMNPGDVHACNPVADHAWSYRMLYLDSAWLAKLQADLREDSPRAFTPFGAVATDSPRLYAAFNALFDALGGLDADTLRREEALVGFFSMLDERLGSRSPARTDSHPDLARAADYIDANATLSLRLDEIAAAAGLSVSYLVRAFAKRYGMTPHEYQINRRIQRGQQQLRRGEPIAQVALDTGFADQAHFQRTFKRLTAATPGQYRKAQASIR